MPTRWKVYWDNGSHACGTFPEIYDTEDDAAAAADAITAENIAQGIWNEEGGAEPIAVEMPDDDDQEEAAAADEQSIEYFDRYIAGDR